jgi:hypothetical protein
MEPKTCCGQDAGAGEAGDTVLAGLPVAALPREGVVVPADGTTATLELGVAVPPPRPKEHPAHAAVTVRAIATDRPAAGNARFVILPVTNVMVRTARTGRSPNRNLTAWQRPSTPA